MGVGNGVDLLLVEEATVSGMGIIVSSNLSRVDGGETRVVVRVKGQRGGRGSKHCLESRAELRWRSVAGLIVPDADE